MAELDARDADRWWAGLTAARRVQLHRMMDRTAREQPVPEEQLALEVTAETPVTSAGH